ncbi:MAG: gliding motility-associated C-terminal domain-containing protein [Bacteroidota bacterium]
MVTSINKTGSLLILFFLFCFAQTLVAQHLKSDQNNITLATSLAGSATISPVPPVCPSSVVNLEVTFTGQGPWNFDLIEGGVFLTPISTSDNPTFIPVTPSGNTTYTIQNFMDANGPGIGSTVSVTILPTPVAVMSLVSSDSICAGSGAVFSIAVSGGSAPFSYVYSINGVNQLPQTSTKNPIVFSTSGLNLDATIALVSLSANACVGTVSGAFPITIGPSLSAELQTGTTLICAGQTEIIDINFIGTGPFTFEYAENGVAQGPITTMDQPYEISATPIADTTIFKLLHVSANNCDGTAFGADTLILTPPPTAVLSGSTTICPGDSAGLVVNFTGTGPYLIQYTANSVLQAPIVAVSNPFILKVGPGINTLYELTQVSVNGCMGTASGTAVVMLEDSLKATIGGGGQVCQGSGGIDLTITFEGAGPYTFVYIASSGGLMDTLPPITTSQNPYSFNANPAIGTFYRLLSVTNNTCSGTIDGQALVFVFTPSTAFMSGSQTFCDTASTDVLIDFTGTGPFEITYKVDGLAQPSITTFDDPFLLHVNTNVSHNYVLTGVTSPGCTGNPSGSAAITVNYKPTYSNIQSACNPVTVDYIVVFDVVNATLPLSLVSGSGTFNGGTHFVSDPIPQGTGYNIVFHDAHSCGDVTVSGSINCSCQTDAGTMSLTPIAVCVPDSAHGNYNNNFFSDGNDILRFILYSNPLQPTSSIIAWNTSPDFPFQAPMQAGITYYISAIAGNPDGTGKIDLNDFCLSVSQGVSLVFNTPPTANLGPDVTVCVGKQATTPIFLTGVPPYSLQWTANGTVQTATNVPGPVYQLSFQALTTTQVILTNVSDSQCSTLLNDTANIIVLPKPQILNLTYNCNLSSGTYTLEFDCVGQSPLTVGGISGAFTGKHFTTVPITAGTAFHITLDDNNGCGRDTMSGNPACACVTNAGVMDPTPIVLCYGDSVIAQPASGYVLEPGDTLFYVLLNAGFSPVATSKQPIFQFDPITMVADSNYLVVAYAGDKANSGIGVDLNDPCLSIAAGTPVRWRKEVLATISGDQTICPGGTAQVLIDFDGTGPFKLSYMANNSVNALTAVTLDPYIISTIPTVNTNYSLISVQDAAGCAGTVSGSALVQEDVQPQVLQVQTICDFATGTYQLQFEIGNGALTNPLYSISGVTGTLTDTTFLSNPIPKIQPYNVTVTNPTGCASTFTGTANCQCPTYSGALDPSAIVVCRPDSNVHAIHNNLQNLDADDILRFVLCKDTAMLPQSILAINSSPDFVFQTVMQTGVTYYIVAVAGSADPSGALLWTDPCLHISNKTPVTFYASPTALINGDTSICKGQNVVFKIRFTGQGPFKFKYAINGNPQQEISAPGNSFNISTNNIQQKQVFTLISVQDAHCPGVVTGTYTINLTTPPTAGLSSDTAICFGGSAMLKLQLTGADSFNLSVSDGTMNIALPNVKNGQTFPVSPSVTTTYTISNVVALGNTCPAGIGQAATVTVINFSGQSTVSDFGGYNLSCADTQDGSIKISTSGGVAPFSVKWNTGADSLNLRNLSAGNYNVTVTDKTGCIYKDSFELTAPDAVAFSFMVNQPSCRDLIKTGEIKLTQASGGVGPYTIDLDGMTVQTAAVFPVKIDKLATGIHTIEVADINGCSVSQQAEILEPLILSVDLGPDQTIYYGDSILLNPHIQGLTQLDTLFWTPIQFLSNPKDSLTYARPERTSTYSIFVRDSSGCTAKDEIRIVVQKIKRVYLPTAILPGSEIGNGVFTVFGGSEVVKVHFMRIFDRWGDQVFSNQNFLPNDRKAGWAAQENGKDVSVGVYVFVLEVEYNDGSSEVFSGDVTVLK